MDGGRNRYTYSGSDQDAGKKVLRAVTATGWNVKAIYNTHSHADHIGGNQYIQKRTGCDIFALEPDLSFVNNPELERPFVFGGYPIKEISNKFFFAKPSLAKPLTDEVLPSGLEMTRLDGHAVSMAGFKTCDGVWFLGDCRVQRGDHRKIPCGVHIRCRGAAQNLR